MNRLQVTDLFHENFSEGGELGASLSVWQNGQEILSLAAGFKDRQKTLPWTVQTPVLIWSATKGLAAACVLHACETHQVSVNSPVANFWPEFAAAGKSAVTVAEVLSHRAGLPAVTHEVSVLDHAAVAEALAAEAPLWPLGSGHGYHPRTFGFLLDEILRRISGIPLGEYWRSVFAEPLGLDLWIGMDASRLPDVSSVFPAKVPPPKDDPFYSAFMTAGTLSARAFASPRGLHSVASMNSPEARTASLPAFGGIGTASSLARFYAMLAEGGALDGRRYFLPSTLELMSTTLAEGFDRVLQLPTAFSAGFMRDPLGSDGQKLRASFGPSLLAFGHPGAGGSHAFADPENQLSFAYVINQMVSGVLPNHRSLRLVMALMGTD